MTQAKHTPGPWQHIISDPAEGYQCIWIKAQPHPAMRGFTKEIGCVSGTNDLDIANARLIAAAPDMLAALKQAEVTIKLLGPVDGAEGAALRDVQSAISKAEGRA